MTRLEVTRIKLKNGETSHRTEVWKEKGVVQQGDNTQDTKITIDTSVLRDGN